MERGKCINKERYRDVNNKRRGRGVMASAMHAFRVRAPLFPCGFFRETALVLPSQCE